MTTDTNTSFKEELEEILDGYALVIWANTGEPDDVLEKINKTALTSIINLVDKEVISLDEASWVDFGEIENAKQDGRNALRAEQRAIIRKTP